MSAGRPGRRMIAAVALLVVAALFAGRWGALETAERAWAASVGAGGGAAYLAMRDVARLVGAGVLVAATAWGIGQLYLVYRAVGSVQLPRRLGNLDIAEAVPRWVLLAITVGTGAVYGALLLLGTGGWWRLALLAAAPPYFGIADPILEYDAGYYVAVVPWTAAVQDRALVAVVSALAVVGALYASIGSLRVERWRATVTPYARMHLGVLLAALAIVCAWGAALDPAEVVAGLHGPVDHAAVTVRLPGASAVALLAGAVALVTLVWAWRGAPALVPHAWTALIAAQLTVYGVAPTLVRAARGRGTAADAPALVAGRAAFAQRAVGLDRAPEAVAPPFLTLDAAVHALPLWDPDRVAIVARQKEVFGPQHRVGAVAPHGPAGGRAAWLLAAAPRALAPGRGQPPPEWIALHRGAGARTGPPLLAVETDSGLAFAPARVRDSVAWFGGGFDEFAIASADTWPELRRTGVALDTWWRRAALAWALQSPELLEGGAERGARHLVWRRDVRERLGRLLPAAQFAEPVPVVADSVLWWVAYGFVVSRTFPLVAPLPRPAGGGPETRYERPGFIGLVRAGDGESRLFLTPEYDSLSAAWARISSPLVLPPESLPPALGARLPVPERWLTLTAAQLAGAASPEWTARPVEPVLVPAPADPRGADAPAVWWLVQGFEDEHTPGLRALLAATMTPRGPRVVWWRPAEPLERAPPRDGSAHAKPGALRLWPVAGPLLSVQAVFTEAAGEERIPQVADVYLSWDGRSGHGPTIDAALLALRTRQPQAPRDTTTATRWRAAQRLLRRADSALAARDLEGFARLYGELKRLLGVPRPQLAPPSPPR